MRHKLIIFWGLLCLLVLTSCEKKVLITDVYYIRNESDQSVSFQGHYMFWDTCLYGQSEEPTETFFSENGVDILAHQSVRLHPISRKDISPDSHQVDIIPIISSRTTLIVGTKSILWISKYRSEPPAMEPIMFTDDSIWSIYNTNCWKTESDSDKPYTYYHTFLITEQNIQNILQQ